ncbi:MAG: hypothetical protein OQJ76_02650, partial [Rhodospirillales bacterium]|nr:hypothetical protein [Rhodospirillales bacterium]
TVGVTFILMGWCAYMTGKAIAGTWRSPWQVVVYCTLLGLMDRFLIYALFEGALLSLTGYIIDTAILIAFGLISFRATQARKMADQYPWIYERSGLFGWRTKSGTAPQ